MQRFKSHWGKKTVIIKQQAEQPDESTAPEPVSVPVEVQVEVLGESQDKKPIQKPLGVPFKAIVEVPVEEPMKLTTVYDPITEGIILISWDEYLQKNLIPRQDWMAEYDETTHSVKLVFWKQYVPVLLGNNAEAATQQAKDYKINDLTSIYDPETKGIKLVSLTDFLAMKKTPKQDWMAEYDEKTQSVQLVFWKPFTIGPKEASSQPVQQQEIFDLTTVYDPETEGVKLVSLADYWSVNKAPKQDWMAQYDEKTQSVQLVFWKPFTLVHKVESSEPVQQQKICDHTTVYDPETEGIKLVSLDEYWAANKAPRQDWMAKYDENTQSVQLVFWKPFTEIHKQAFSQSLQPNEICDLTTIYDPETEGIKLLSLVEYWTANNAPRQDWMTEYDEKTQSVKLVFWRPFTEVNKEASSHPIQPEAVSDVTTMYDPETEGIKLVSLAEYWAANKAPKQDWMAEYDEKTQSVQLVFWKPFAEVHKQELPYQIKLKEFSDLTTIYVPETEGIKLVSLAEYWAANNAPKQDWMAEYDEKTQSVQLVFWKPFTEVHKQALSHQIKSKEFSDLTTMYDPETEGIKLVSLAEYWTANNAPRQDWMAEYDAATQSVKLAFWKPYSGIQESTSKPQLRHSSSLVSSVETKETAQLSMTTVYNEETQSVDLISYDQFARSNKIPKQDYAAVYDETNQCVKLIYWKDYQESQKVAPLQTVEVNSISVNPKGFANDFTTVITEDIELMPC